MKQNKSRIQIILSIIALIISIIGILAINLKTEDELKIKPFFIGLIGSICGAVMSILLSRISSKKVETKVFIAYTFNDKEVANKISNSFDEKHIQVIKEDEELQIGVDLQQQVKKSLKDVDVVIVLISKDFYKSKNLKKVIELSKTMNKKILPITIDESNLPNNISNLYYLDASNDIDKATQEIVDKVMHLEKNERPT